MLDNLLLIFFLYHAPIGHVNVGDLHLQGEYDIAFFNLRDL